jgi:hypothetical protein
MATSMMKEKTRVPNLKRVGFMVSPMLDNAADKKFPNARASLVSSRNLAKKLIRAESASSSCSVSVSHPLPAHKYP